MTAEERESLNEIKSLKEQIYQIYSATLQASTVILPYSYYSDEPDSPEAQLDFLQGLAVNDSPYIIWLIADYWFELPPALREAIGGSDHVRDLFVEAEGEPWYE